MGMALTTSKHLLRFLILEWNVYVRNINFCWVKNQKILEFTMEIKNEFKEKMPFLNEYSGYTQTTFLPLTNRSLLGKIRLRGFSSKRRLSIGVS